MRKKGFLQVAQIVAVQPVTAAQDDPFGFHFGAQVIPCCLLRPHEIARILVDQHQLLGRGQPVGGGGVVSRLGQFAQAGNPHGIKFVQVGCRD